MRRPVSRRDALSSQWKRTRGAKEETGMRKNSKTPGSSKRVVKARKTDRMTIGMDLGDKRAGSACWMKRAKSYGKPRWRRQRRGWLRRFGAMAYCRIALEVGTHSP